MESAEGLFSITIPQLAERYKIGQWLNNNFIITSRAPEYIEALSYPLRVDALLIGICLKGSIKISTNLKEWVLTENTCIISLPENVIGVKEISPDNEGVIIAISLDYLRKINLDLKTILPYYVLVRNYPCIKLEGHETERLNQFFQLISLCLKDEDSSRKEDIIQGLFSALVFKISENLDRTGASNRALKTKSKEYYFMRFMELLLKDFRENRNVGYYADKMAVTPKYLSALIKEISGSSAAQWIDEYTIMEASMLLKFSDKNIQQVADSLNFPSQSFFSKYFKHHTGLTPSEYRESSRKG